MKESSPVRTFRVPARAYRLGSVLLLGVLLCARSLPSQVQGEPGRIRELARTIDSLRIRGDDAGLGREYVRLADLHYDAERTPLAIDAYRRATHHSARAVDSATMAVSHNGLGLSHWRATRYDSALANLSRSRVIREALGDRTGVALVLNSIGASYYQLGQYEPALDAFMQSLAIRREEGDTRRIAVILTNVGKTYQDFRQYERAREVLEEAVAAAESARVPVVLGYALHTLGVLQLDLGKHAEARALFMRSLASYADSTVSPSDAAGGWSLNAVVMGRLSVREGHPEAAIRQLDSVLVVAERRKSVRGQARTLLHLGEAYRALGQRSRAIDAVQRSFALSRAVEQRVLALEAVALLADLEEDAGNSRLALGHLRTAHALRDTIFDQSTGQRIAAMEARDEAARGQRENTRLRAEHAAQRAVIARQRTVVTLGAVILILTTMVLALVSFFMRKGKVREALLGRTNAELARTNAELQTALSEVRTLTGLIPICANCKKVRDDDGYWEAVETYISSRSSAIFNHSICGSCGPELYGEHWQTDLPAAAVPER